MPLTVILIIFISYPLTKGKKWSTRRKNKEQQITQRTQKQITQRNTNTRKRNNNLAKEADKMIVRS